MYMFRLTCGNKMMWMVGVINGVYNMYMFRLTGDNKMMWKVGVINGVYNMYMFRLTGDNKMLWKVGVICGSSCLKIIIVCITALIIHTTGIVVTVPCRMHAVFNIKTIFTISYEPTILTVQLACRL